MRRENTLEYLGRGRGRVPTVGEAAAAICLAAVMFAAGHWVMELAMQYVYMKVSPPPARRWPPAEAAADRMFINMVIESMYAVGEFFVMVLGQGVGFLFTKRLARWRVVVAGFLGAAYCLARWGLYFVMSLSDYPPIVDLAVAMALTMVFAGIVVTWDYREKKVAMRPNSSR